MADNKYKLENPIPEVHISGIVNNRQAGMLWYPHNNSAKIIASIAKTTTLTDTVLRQLEKLGFKIVIVAPEPTWRKKQ